MSVVLWEALSAITFGAALSFTLLNAVANLPGALAFLRVSNGDPAKVLA
jgi:hypothetical protein